MGLKMRVLMTGAGAPGGPGIINCLIKDNNIDLYICDSNPKAIGKFIIPEKFHKIPKASENNFIDEIIKLCHKHKIQIILPLVTKELFQFSKNKEYLKNLGIKVIVSDFKSLEIANDKGNLYRHLSKKNIELPKFKIVENLTELKNAVTSLGYPKLPVVIKPCFANGSRGVRILDQKQDRFKLFFNEKPNSIFDNLDNIIDILSEKRIPRMLISENLPGQELTVDTIIKNGKIYNLLIRTRDVMRGGISVAGTFIENNDVSEYITKIINSLPGLSGPVGFQIKESSKKKYLLLECNPRLQGSSVAALGLDINLPIRSLKDNIEDQYSIKKRVSGVSFFKYYKEIFYDNRLSD